ncbi:hypothetical protein [Alloprevotella rava]|uniref:Outer membrane protein OmpA-like peptidoglycan-associated protein n=1 Tax=Alloprevotella rava TaxID=671218 RepID=A0A7W5UCP5_9BACT|nr:hypothetical protein [Alloprevotella rava]MBB3701564.1 outer membrane protein OmpA-like peptidoglycan-associated protein [Alloprevotella rava]
MAVDHKYLLSLKTILTTKEAFTNLNAPASDTALLLEGVVTGGTLNLMNNRQTKPLIPPLSGRWTKMGLSVLFFSTLSVSALAQTNDGKRTLPPQNQNSELRTRTWSIYAEGGLSWSTDVWYQNINAKKSYNQSPAVGGGVDFTIRPWVRVGAEYLWSRYRREQRFSKLDPTTMPIKAYGNYLMNYHNAKLGVGFNAMELWPRRRAQWFNIWISTGIGYTTAKGNEHGIFFSNTKTQGGQTTPIGEGTSISNDSEVTITGNVRTTNRHENFDNFYIPASLHFEADVTRRFTIGLKGEMDWLIKRKDIAPKNLIAGLATVRYNFVPSRAKGLKTFYDGEISSLNNRINELRQTTAVERERAAREAAERQRLERENAELQRKLSECKNKAPEHIVKVEEISHFVQFANDSFKMSREEAYRLKMFAQSVKGQKLALVAEASTPGQADYNQRLSEKRLEQVIKALVKEGIAKADITPQIAIGERDGKPTAEGRRVTIKVEK